jgi:hypothetical protein
MLKWRQPFTQPDANGRRLRCGVARLRPERRKTKKRPWGSAQPFDKAGFGEGNPRVRREAGEEHEVKVRYGEGSHRTGPRARAQSTARSAAKRRQGEA